MSSETTFPFLELGKDLKDAVATMTPQQARYLVDTYYQMQDNRIRAAGQIRSMADEPHAVLDWLEENSARLEHCVKLALSRYAKSKHMGQWAMGVVGIGPVISAGLLAHIDITRAPTVGHIWRYAGLDPTSEWKKGEKRPWNASLKVLCWKAGESFVKVSGNPKAQYGRLYAERKALETERNERGDFADQAARIVEKVPGHAQRAIYKEGMLPPGHIHSRAKRYAVKIFLSHWHGEAYRDFHGKEPPLPYPVAHQGHAHVIEHEAIGSE